MLWDILDKTQSGTRNKKSCTLQPDLDRSAPPIFFFQKMAHNNYYAFASVTPS